MRIEVESPCTAAAACTGSTDAPPPPPPPENEKKGKKEKKKSTNYNRKQFEHLPMVIWYRLNGIIQVSLLKQVPKWINPKSEMTTRPQNRSCYDQYLRLLFFNELSTSITHDSADF